MKIDKQNGNVAFNEDEHVYWNVEHPKDKYVSVTTLIESFGQPFLKNFWSAYKALEKLLNPEAWKVEKSKLLATKKFDKEIINQYDIDINLFNKTQQDILDQWQEENQKSCERGTKIHAMLEQQMYKAGANITFKKLGIGGKFTCDKGRTTLDLENGVYPEYLLHYDSPDGILHLAGQTDLMIIQGQKLWVADYKSNKKIEQRGFFDKTTKKTQKMKYPLNTIEDCNYGHYQLQLSTYAWMIQQMRPDLEVQDLILIHYDHQGKQTIYHCDYLMNDVVKMLKWYKKELIHQKNEEKYKDIEY